MRNNRGLVVWCVVGWCCIALAALVRPSMGQIATSRPVETDGTKKPSGFVQITLAPNWGAREPLRVPLVTNVQVRPAESTVAQDYSEWRNCVRAYQRSGAAVGWYVSPEALVGDDPYLPPTLLTADPAWTPTAVRFVTHGIYPAVTLYEGGAQRWQLDLRDSRTAVRVAKRTAALYRERLAAANRGAAELQQVRPDFIFIDNFGHTANGGPYDWTSFGDYAELLGDATAQPILVNCTATPDDWPPSDWERVAFLSETIRSDGRWLGVYFEAAHRWVQYGSGPALEAETAAYQRLLDLRVRVLWDAALAGIPDGREAGAARLAALAGPLTRPGLGPYVGCDWFRPAPSWSEQTRGP